MNRRGSGILLHVTSLPSKFGIGDLGPTAYQFVDFLKASRNRYWQILPLNPSGTFVGSSPYASYSAFAGNPLLISPEGLVKDGLLQESELTSEPFAADKVEYKRVIEHKTRILQSAYDRHMLTAILRPEFEEFCRENESWLEDFRKIHKLAVEKNIQIYFITNDFANVTDWITKNGFNSIQVLKCDFVAIKTAARANPTLYLLQEANIVNKWSYAEFDKVEEELGK